MSPNRLGESHRNILWKETNPFQHYADGDVVNNTTKVGKASISDDAMSVWGPDRPIGWIK